MRSQPRQTSLGSRQFKCPECGEQPVGFWQTEQTAYYFDILKAEDGVLRLCVHPRDREDLGVDDDQMLVCDLGHEFPLPSGVVTVWA